MKVVPSSRQGEGGSTVKPWNSLLCDAVCAKHVQGEKQSNISQEEKCIDSHDMQTS